MRTQSDPTKETYVVFAPKNSDVTVPGALLSVDVNTDEEVEWIWTHLNNGQSAVTGYQIIKK